MKGIQRIDIFLSDIVSGGGGGFAGLNKEFKESHPRVREITYIIGFEGSNEVTELGSESAKALDNLAHSEEVAATTRSGLGFSGLVRIGVLEDTGSISPKSRCPLFRQGKRYGDTVVKKVEISYGRA